MAAAKVVERGAPATTTAAFPPPAAEDAAQEAREEETTTSRKDGGEPLGLAEELGETEHQRSCLERPPRTSSSSWEGTGEEEPTVLGWIGGAGAVLVAAGFGMNSGAGLVGGETVGEGEEGSGAHILRTGTRFDILIDNATWNGSQRYTPKYLSAEVVKRLVQGPGQHDFSLVATPDATLPPILNAFEIYSVKTMNGVMTDDAEAKAMMTIRTNYALKKNWMGDPCAPKEFAWDGLNCSYPSTGPARVTVLRLASSGLTGAIDSSFGDLKSLQYLDLSNNSLSGPVPAFLAQMPSLTFLDLSSNNFSGSVPADLLEKGQNGSLVLRIGNNANLCENGASNCDMEESNRTLVIEIVVPIAVATIPFVTAFLIAHRIRKPQGKWMDNNSRLSSPRDRSDVFDHRQFTYKELKLMTANFREERGRGGFGPVFKGYLDNETPVAVKMRSQTSSQGNKEFLAETCYNQYVVIPITGEAFGATALTWHQRLKIASTLHMLLHVNAGLEYLHKSCQPPLIHRDVKTKNILLSANLVAKIADFGLMKAFADEFRTHVTTQPAGTLGYLDPEYYNTSQLSEKSDVYSFGVVLLELITGQPSSIPVSNTESIHIAQWVRQKLSEGDITGIADPRMAGEYDCKEQPSRKRPTMTDIVMELKECLELEVAHAMSYDSSVPSSANNLSATSGDLHNDAQASYHLGQQIVPELEQVGEASASHVGPTPR
ncbi:unnamed protein product [Miscanthus lutarioriparius]|uniref:non-specific serine/threonine protein kinase n=1 Tax=Miscanthus lutarioriparius TaxID=422564 RepID=A0A811RBQ1_9POAL|nr:unnamed protein product [Miscanthus lutarioriparius]